MYKRLRIRTSVDRPHIAFDCLSVFKKVDLGITWMETYTKELFIKVESPSDELWAQIKSDLLKIPDVELVDEVELIAFELRNLEFKELLNTLEKTVFLVDFDGEIKYTNAKKMLSKNGEEITGNIFDYIDDEDLKNHINMQDYKKFITEIVIDEKLYLLNVYNFVGKGSHVYGYIITLDNISEVKKISDQRRYASNITFRDLIYQSKSMTETVNKGIVYSQSDSAILIRGESGTGKEMFTRSIHNLSSRRESPFIALNCASLPEQLLESELFGYVEGAFTGAIKGGKEGIFEIANGGTIFLDEIADMPIHLQSKLLRVLQEKKVRRIGGATENAVDFRIISATNRNLEELVAEKKFRLDLLYRINTLSLEIPPLRVRKDDVGILVNHFLDILNRRYRKNINSVSPEAMTALKNYDWPGNVRELQNVIERAVALTDGGRIEADFIIFDKPDGQKFSLEDGTFDDKVTIYETSLIEEALSKADSIRSAARDLGITHTKLLNRMKKYGIEKN
ncbi:MAG: sigma 54-interacting transcriptional regulator [Tissierellia bacterium]|nr:sigma 54-interacting transcriptional regulator [Tissierellia bacterium]